MHAENLCGTKNKVRKKGRDYVSKFCSDLWAVELSPSRGKTRNIITKILKEVFDEFENFY